MAYSCFIVRCYGVKLKIELKIIRGCWYGWMDQYDEWINILSQKFLEIWGLIQAWWFPVGAFTGSFWLIIKKIWPWSKGLWDAREKLKQLQSEQKNLNLREELILIKEENFKLKEEVARLSNQFEIKESVVWKDCILYHSGDEICSLL